MYTATAVWDGSNETWWRRARVPLAVLVSVTSLVAGSASAQLAKKSDYADSGILKARLLRDDVMRPTSRSRALQLYLMVNPKLRDAESLAKLARGWRGRYETKGEPRGLELGEIQALTVLLGRNTRFYELVRAESERFLQPVFETATNVRSPEDLANAVRPVIDSRPNAVVVAADARAIPTRDRGRVDVEVSFRVVLLHYQLKASQAKVQSMELIYEDRAVGHAAPGADIKDPAKAEAALLTAVRDAFRKKIAHSFWANARINADVRRWIDSASKKQRAPIVEASFKPTGGSKS